MPNSHWRTTPPRVALAFVVGALIGAATYYECSAVFGGPLTSPAPLSPETGEVESWGETMHFALQLALVIGWAGGLLAVGGPAWIALHRLRLTGPLPFVVATTVLGVAFPLVLSLLAPPAFVQIWASSLRLGPTGLGLLAGGIGGALSGLGMWRIAYRRVPSTEV